MLSLTAADSRLLAQTLREVISRRTGELEDLRQILQRIEASLHKPAETSSRKASTVAAPPASAEAAPAIASEGKRRGRPPGSGKKLPERKRPARGLDPNPAEPARLNQHRAG